MVTEVNGMNPKLKRVLVILGMICAVFLGVTLLFGKAKVAPWNVDKIVLETTDYCYATFDSIELDRMEINRFLWRFNFSVNAGQVDVDRPYSDFSVKIYLKNGKTISLRDYKDGKLYYSASGDRCWIYNQGLWNYIEKLISLHHMARE